MKDRTFDFLKIADAEAHLDQRVNLLGIVTETGIPKITKGKDLFTAVKIFDESRPALGFYIHFFAETVEKLPRVENAGDIILVSDVVVKAWGSDYYALYRKKTSSFALFEGRDPRNKEIVPYQFSSGYLPVHESTNFIHVLMGLKKWSIEHVFLDMSDLISLNKIKEGELCNLLCKILHVSQVDECDWIIYVWDGTDAPPVAIETNLENETRNSSLVLPLHPEAGPLSRSFLRTFPRVGTVLRMFAHHQDKEAIKLLKANKWVKFLGVKCEVHSTLWRAVLMPFSKFCLLSDGHDSVVARQRFYEERIDAESPWGRMPMTCFPWPSRMIETCHQEVPFVTLMDVLADPQGVGKYRCVVRIVEMIPVDLSILRLSLEDPTARIRAFASAEKFLDSMEGFAEKRKALMGVGEDDDVMRPPWIECCLLSYCCNDDDDDDDDGLESRIHALFDTRFV